MTGKRESAGVGLVLGPIEDYELWKQKPRERMKGWDSMKLLNLTSNPRSLPYCRFHPSQTSSSCPVRAYC